MQIAELLGEGAEEPFPLAFAEHPEDLDSGSHGDSRTEGSSGGRMSGPRGHDAGAGSGSGGGVGPLPAHDVVRVEGEAVVHHGFHFTQSRDAAPVLVRQVPSQGLSFQLWPAAVALCHFLEHLHHLPRHTASPPLPNQNSSSSSSSSSSISGGNASSGRRESDSGTEQGTREDSKGSCMASGIDRAQGPLTGLRVLEVGAGTGLAGIVAARLGAHVTLTDLPHALPNLRANAELNAHEIGLAGGSVDVSPLSWGLEPDAAVFGGRVDVVLGADVVYYDSLFEPLVSTLRWLAAANANRSANAALHRTIAEKFRAVDRRERGSCSRTSTVRSGEGVAVNGDDARASAAMSVTPFVENSCVNAVAVNTRHSSATEPLNPHQSSPAPSNMATDLQNCVDASRHFPPHHGVAEVAHERGVKAKSATDECGVPSPSTGESVATCHSNPSNEVGMLVLLAHVRRWKKDNRFFRLARKHFDVQPIGWASHEHTNAQLFWFRLRC